MRTNKLRLKAALGGHFKTGSIQNTLVYSFIVIDRIRLTPI